MLRLIPSKVWIGAGLSAAVLAFCGGLYLLGMKEQARRDRLEQLEQREKARERSDDIRDEVDRRDDDALVDGIVRD